MKKLFLIILILVGMIMCVSSQGFMKKGDVFAGSAEIETTEKSEPLKSANSIKVEEIVINLGEDEYFRYMPQNLYEAQELIRNLVKAYEKVANLSLQYSESHLEQLETLIIDADGLDDELVPIKESLTDYSELIDSLNANQAKRLAIGLFAQGEKSFLTENWSVSFGPMIQINFLNSVLFGAGVGVVASSNSIGGAAQLQIAMWK